MQKIKRKSEAESDNQLSPKKSKSKHATETQSIPKKNFSKAEQRKKDNLSGKPKKDKNVKKIVDRSNKDSAQNQIDRSEKNGHVKFQKNKGDSQKGKDGSTPKNKGSFVKGKDGSFQKGKGGGFHKGKDGDLSKRKGRSFQKGEGGGFQKGKDGGFRKGKDGGFQKGKDGGFQKGKGQAQTEKPVWSEMKKQKKELRLERRKTKATVQVFEISHKAKVLASQIQRKVLQASVREKLCTELHSLLKGQYTSIALTHDLSRVIQVLLKYSGEDIRIQISEELLPIVVQMIQSKYAHHSVKRILKYGADGIKEKLIEKLLGSIVTLATHSVSAPVLDYAYGEHASNKQKLFMQQEFYGDIYKNSKDVNIKRLSDTYKNSPEMKEAILSTLKSNIQRVLDKNLHDGELLHSVLYQYMCECSADERAELITTLSPLIVPLSNSLPGVNAASLCVWSGTNKDKKTIMKVVKEHAVALSTHKSGYRLLLAIFDSVDDTVLVKKAIVSSIAKCLKDIAVDHWGKMVLHWLVKPSDPAGFHPALVKELKAGAASGSSKKNSDVRIVELREAIVPTLYEDIQANAKFWMSDPSMALLIAAVLTTGPPKEVMSALVKVICQADWTIQREGKDVLAVEDAGIHVCLKKIAQNDKQAGDVSFGECLAEELTDDTLNVWLTKNRGCFVLLKAIECNSKEIADRLVEKIKPHRRLLEKQSTPGAKLLLQNI